MENNAKITLNGKEYPLLLSTYALKKIGEKFGDIEKLGDALTADGNTVDALNNVIWLITLLANQPILIYNRAHVGEEQPLLTEEDLELMTTPADLGVMQYAVKIAIERGSSRSVFSENSKNA